MFPLNEFQIQPCGILQACANAICTPLKIPNYPTPGRISRQSSAIDFTSHR
ncbi:hypothetical protein O181_010291, partial [Austropuccinia psidii MF-1]|nr:hypothetical protein [Austropuccinia psidii MF-1]